MSRNEKRRLSRAAKASKPKAVFGKRHDCALKAGKLRHAEYFVFRVDPELSVETVKQQITDGGATVVEIERMSQDNAVTQSFRVLVNVDDPNKLYSEDFWGDGVGCRRFYSLCRLFNLMISHGYVPHSLLQATVISIPKDTRASLCKSDNYRGIALCNSIGKLFDLMILGKFESCFYSSDMQFGFKRGMSTTLCTATLRETMYYFSRRGSDAFVCFLDARTKPSATF
ncbi:hypothetical protein CAPTEDRAFT_206880 [Capitella teleta]|uniref:Reverse transcriptase domain-containing protein n=1 Tax=Capitella teleta TaxID=283909 RepID=R7UGA5_CAPTE|nr:hypothetical protein CAPTEDRAFT_206880 [Capitella teleta]|eukprot:ELU05250.1 hypothetical protein CAPTEDRAFT_206880 [Capitella teleta]